MSETRHLTASFLSKIKSLNLLSGGTLSFGFNSPFVFRDVPPDYFSFEIITNGVPAEYLRLNYNGSLTISGSIAATTADTVDFGSTSGELRSIYLGDTGRLYFGLDQDISLKWNNTGSGVVLGEFELYDAGGTAILEYYAEGNAGTNTFGEWRIIQSRAYDATTTAAISPGNPNGYQQAPLLNLQQLSTGECAMRYMHPDDTGSNNWLHGELGRKTGVGTAHTHYYHWLDGVAVSFQTKNATDTTGGRILVNTAFWANPASARLEVRGSADEVQLLLKGNSSQGNPIFQIVNSSDAELLAVSNGGIMTVNEIAGRDAYGALYINGSSGDDTPTAVVLRTGDNQAASVLVSRLTIAGDAAVSDVTWNAVNHQFGSGNIGFFGVTTAGQQSHIVDADGTLADITSKFNSLLSKLETYGLLATS